MINFIIGEDNKQIHLKIKNVIQRIMLKNNMAFKSFSFFDYDNSFIEKIKEKIPNKIYILDIVTPTRSGIEMARIIRETDIDSIIIFLTAYKNEFKETIYESEFMAFGLLSKQDNYETLLADKISSALKYVSRKNAIRFLDQKLLYTIPMKDILYITTDTKERKTLIITDYTTFKVNKPLCEIKEMLNEFFIKTHRACIINKERMICFDFKNRIINFDNHMQIDLISRDYKKKLHHILKTNESFK